MMTLLMPPMRSSSLSDSKKLKFDAYAAFCNLTQSREAVLAAGASVMLVRLLAAAVVLVAIPPKVVGMSAVAVWLIFAPVVTPAVATSFKLTAKLAATSAMMSKIALQTQRSATRGLHPPWREEAGLTKAWSGHPA